MDVAIIGLDPSNQYGAATTSWFLYRALSPKHAVTLYSLTSGWLGWEPTFENVEYIGLVSGEGLKPFERVKKHEMIIMVHGLHSFDFRDCCKILRKKTHLLIYEDPAPVEADYFFDLFDYVFTCNKSQYYRTILEKNRENVRFAPLAVDKERLYPIKGVDPRSVFITGDETYAKDINPMIPKLEKALGSLPLSKKWLQRYTGMKPTNPSFDLLDIHLAREDILMFLRRAWIYINLHPAEKMGYLTMETLMAGTPVIAFHHGDLDLFEHKQQGILIPRCWDHEKWKWVVKGDLEQHFRESVSQILDDFDGFSKRARRYALEHFDPEKNGKVWEKALEKIYSENAPCKV